jgi:hypothetical protein
VNNLRLSAGVACLGVAVLTRGQLPDGIGLPVATAVVNAD